VYGTLQTTASGKVKVKLVRFDSAKAGSEMHQRSFTLTSQTPKRLGKELARSAAQMFDRTPPPEPVDPSKLKVTEPVKPELTDPPIITDSPPTPSDEPSSGGKITGSTWGLIGGGGLGVAVGAGFLISARSLKGLVEAAPCETTANFRRLTTIERAGRIRTQVGGTLLVAGGAVLAVGAVRAVLQRGGGHRQESMERSVGIVPVEGGAAIVFSGGLR
jgi:hypothetical protein